MALPNGAAAAGDINGIEYIEAEGSGNLSLGTENARGTREFYVDWSDRIAFATALLGNNTQGSSAQIAIAPQTFPGYDFLQCKSVEIEGLGQISNSGGTFSYPFAKVTASYEKESVQSGGFGGGGSSSDDVLATEEIDVGYETLNWAGVAVQYTTTKELLIGDVVDGAKRVPVIRHTLTEERTLNNRKAAIAACSGKVNQVAFLDVAPGKMLYEGAQMRRVITADGNQPYRLVHTFLERVGATWNEFFDPKQNAFDGIEDLNGAAVDIYEEIDFIAQGLLG